MRSLLFACICNFFGLSASAQFKPSVSFEKWLSLKTVGGVTISPDGKHVLYGVTSTNWKDNNYDSEIWLYRNGEAPFQLTNTSSGSSSNAQFTPDSKWVSFLSDRSSKQQLYLISVDGGEAFAISQEDDGIGGYSWKPDGKQIAFTRSDPESKTDKASKERFGAFGVEGEEYRQQHLWLLDFNLDSIRMAGMLPCYDSPAGETPAEKRAVEGGATSGGKSPADEKSPAGESPSGEKALTCYTMPKAKRLTSGDFSVMGFDWSPDGKQIAFTRQPNPLINSSLYADIAVLQLDSGTHKTVVQNPSSDFFIRWSPDSRSILFISAVNDTVSYFYKNNRVFIQNLVSGTRREIFTTVDEDKQVIDWNASGIYFSYIDRMRNRLFRFIPSTGEKTEINTGLHLPSGFSFSDDGQSMALSGRNYDKLNDVYQGSTNGALKKVSNMQAQIAGWNTPVNEVISWKSQDGTEIEGVLIKPSNYDPSKKYPLLVVIHGGPTGIDRPDPAATYVYPIMQWCERGAIVLRVNYRGSTGYGEKFRSLNVRNLGVGDMWDVMSGVDHLIKKGWVDEKRMGCMGWSQGGYISAFLSTNTNRFKAISVGAGISNWMTYYVNTDITPFTRQYLQSTPWSDAAIYAKTSPMTNINKASTPTMIQHGEFDKRVPIPNAYELYRGLQDRGIPSKLIVYKGFGHGITKPKERLAAVQHNWEWFGKYVFGD
jgi:dipeptidyl aminopeptidase/acylaminoacyl peptidase